MAYPETIPKTDEKYISTIGPILSVDDFINRLAQLKYINDILRLSETRVTFKHTGMDVYFDFDFRYKNLDSTSAGDSYFLMSKDSSFSHKWNYPYNSGFGYKGRDVDTPPYQYAIQGIAATRKMFATTTGTNSYGGNQFVVKLNNGILFRASHGDFIDYNGEYKNYIPNIITSFQSESAISSVVADGGLHIYPCVPETFGYVDHDDILFYAVKLSITSVVNGSTPQEEARPCLIETPTKKYVAMVFKNYNNYSKYFDGRRIPNNLLFDCE